MITDQIADLLTRVRNACGAGHKSVRIPASKRKMRLLHLLKEEGYIEHFEMITDESNKPVIVVQLKYDNSGRAVIRSLERLSRPGKRIYVGKDDVPRYKGGLGTVVVSTSSGVITAKEARKIGVGGELVCAIF